MPAHRSAAVAVALALTLNVGPAGAAAGPRDTRALALNCLTCHTRAAGSDVPPLAGRTADDIAEAMRAFRSGGRPATIMDRIARGYSDEEIERLAAYLARP